MSDNSKKNKRLIRLFDRQILKFKTLDEDHEICRDDDVEGARDLIFRIESFRKKLTSEKSEQLAKEFHLPGYNTQSKPPAVTGDSEIEESSDTPDSEPQKSKHNVGGWQKKLLREIVKKTHPDKVLSYSIVDQEFYAEICRNATASYESGDYVKLMSCGSDVRLKPTPVTEKDHLSLIKDKIDKLESSLSVIKKNHGYIWYHLPEQEKETFLTNYMKQLGYVVEKSEVVEVIRRKRPVRKPGTRPENHLRKQRVKK
tara:strand:- start:159 stop:926 length:768 start_codon:yes stop_codon:yes gene_type:complete